MTNPFRIIDGSLPVSSLLYEDEELVSSQDGVGLYDGKEKTVGRQNGTIQLTTHRLMYIDQAYPQRNSLSLALSAVRQTEFYAGFLTSSPKITIFIHTDTRPPPTPTTPSSSLLPVINVGELSTPMQSWVCPVCSYNNPPTASEGRPKCVLCGVIRDNRAYVASITHTPLHRSPSLPSLRLPVSSTDSPLSESLTISESSNSQPESIECSVCTYLNHPSMTSCEVCGTLLYKRKVPSRSSGSTPFSSSPPPSTPNGTPLEASIPSRDMLRMSFRKGGYKPFYNSLKKALMRKAWEGSDALSQRGSGGASGAPRLGIQGIFESMDNNVVVVSENMHAGLRDLEALMTKAKEMVELASSLNTKLTAQEEEQARRRALHPDLSLGLSMITEPEEATFIRSSLAQLGLPTMAVTQDMVKDEDSYHEELARELAGILSGKGVTGKGLLGTGEGIIGLDEVWCGWNRARGVALVPPSSLLLSVPYLSQYTSPPIELRVFRSGLRVLHTPKYSNNAFSERLVALLNATPAGFKTIIDIAMGEHMSVGLAEEMIQDVEDAGRVARDDGGANDETRWYVNILHDYVWDGAEAPS
ncbi:hypothetical protein BS47DRAFT_1316509 [Hydnum rufescens UP504]|uniref:Vacuolar protein-sorting-associated protein 36 n=1 Tax=Hydnum rufescens UP504 TaxID=1448309 RepID=A0A9P6AZJ8_9AGAM|nr:hypothetical protein BS47DRAFT_1316509 [Hydnum rufescens UP504]